MISLNIAIARLLGYGRPRKEPYHLPIHLEVHRERARWVFDGARWVHDYNYPGSGEWVYQWHLKDRPGVIWQWARWDYIRHAKGES